MRKEIPIYCLKDFKKIYQKPKGNFVLKRNIEKEDSSESIISFLKSLFSDSLSFPISEFNGVLDGNGHSLVGFESPLFESNNGVIKNLHMENIEVEEDKTSTILERCHTGVLANTNNGTIKNCSIKNLRMDMHGNHSAGLCEHNNGKIKNCQVLSALISCSSQVGGICNRNEGEIFECHFEGRIEIENASIGTAFIVGRNKQDIEKCSAENSEIHVDKGKRYVVGGLVGRNSGEIKDSYTYENNICPDEGGDISGKNRGKILNCHHQEDEEPVGVNRGETDIYEINDISNIWNEILVNKI